MKIAELFVGLGIKGGDESYKQVQKVDKGLKGIVTTGLAVKAGLLAMTYGLQRLMNKASMAGASLNQFENSTGLSAQKLQKWQYAGRQFNVGADEVTQSIRSVQDAMTNMLLGKGAPEGFGMVANMVDIDPNKVRDTFYVMEKLQEFARQVPADVSKNMMKSFGLSEGVIAAMRQNAFRPDVFQQAPIYTADEIKKLRVLNVGWENLGDKIDKAIGRLNAKHGGQFLKDITKLSENVLNLADSLATLAEKLEVFKTVSTAFEGWNYLFEWANKGDMENIDTAKPKGERRFGEGTWWQNGIDSMVDSFMNMSAEAKGNSMVLSNRRPDNNSPLGFGKRNYQ